MKSILSYFSFNKSELAIWSRRRAFTSTILIILLTISAIQIPISNLAADGETLKVFKFGMAKDVGTLNPFAATSDNEYWIMEMIYDYLYFPTIYNETWPTLVQSGWLMDGATATSQPEPTDFLTFEHNASADDWPLGSVWEYNLTENVFWNDGTPFTADDVVFTIHAQIGPNYNVYWAFQPTTRWIDHVEKVTDYKVRIFFSDYDTKEPFPVAFGDGVMLPIMPEHYFGDKVSTYMASEWNGMPTISTGPFMGTTNLHNELLAGEMCTLVPNPYYNFADGDGVRKGLGASVNMSSQIDKVIIKFFTEEATLSLAVRLGNVDVAPISALTYLNWMQDSTLPEELQIISMLSTWQYSRQVSFNAYADAAGSMNPLRLDPAVYRAASLATNKSLLLKIVYKDLGIEGIGLISPYAEDWWWEPGNETSRFNLTDGNGDIIPAGSYSKPMKEVMEYDLDLANDILNAAGYVWTGEEGNSVREAGPLVGERMQRLFGINPAVVVGETLDFDVVVMQEVSEDRQIYDILAQQWKEVGIRLTQNLVTGALWDEMIYEYAFEVMITYWSGDYDPNYLCFIPTSYAMGGWNEFGTTNEDYDNLYLKQASALDFAERKYWTDECLKWHYLSGSINTLAYPEMCYAYNEIRWTNWVEEEPYYSYLYLEYIFTEENGQINPYLVAIAGIAVIAFLIAITFAIRSKKRKEHELFTKEDEENK